MYNSKEYYKKWRAINKDKIKLDKHNEYVLNKETIKTRTKEWQKKNKERYTEIRKKYLTSLKGKITKQINRENRRALEKSSGDGTVNRKSITGLYIIQSGKCAISGKELNYKFHIDHIKPLSKGGLHTISNIQLLLPIENLKKGSKIYE